MKADKNTSTTAGRAFLAVAVVVFLALWFWGMRDKDVYFYQTKEAGYLDGYTADAASDFAGRPVAEWSGIRNLYPGRYTLTVPCEAAGGGRLEILDAESGAVLATADYPDAGTRADVDFSLLSHVTGLLIRSYQGDAALTLGGYTLASQGPVYTDSLWCLALAMLFLAGLWVCVRRYRAGHPQPLALLLMSAAASLPFLTDHLPYGHDLHFHLSRIYGLAAALLDGQFPARLNLDFFSGAGYISPIMYPELFLYPSGLMCALGASVLLAVKVLLVLIVFLTVFISYYAMRQMLGDKAAMIFTFLYLCCPYRLDDIYIRAALGEALAMAFLPAAVVGIWQLVEGDHRKGFWTALLGITGVLQSHIITAFLVVLFGMAYGVAALVRLRRRFWADGRPGTLVAAAGATVLLNLWFLVPFLHFSRWDLHIFHEQGYLDSSAIYLWQAFMDSYSTGGDNFTTATVGEMPLSIGLVLLVGVLLSVYRLLGGKGSGLQKGLLALGTVSLVMSSTLFPWARLQRFRLVEMTFCKMQFAWRILVIAAVLYSAATALEIAARLQERQTVCAGVMLTLALVTALNASSQYLAYNNTLLADSSADWQHDWVYEGQYLLWQHDFGAVGYQARQVGVRTESPAAITDYEKHGTTVRFGFACQDAAAPLEFRVPLYHYGLAQAKLEDGQALSVAPDGNYGMVQVTVPAGIAGGTVTIQYREPLRFRLAELITLATAAGLVWLRRRRHGKRRPPDAGAAASDRPR